MDNINYRGIPTSLFLNGPKLGIATDPQNQSGVIGVATFTGIATASFPNPTDGANDGSIAFKWYYDGSQILDTAEDSNSNASIVGFSSATGTGSTITINGLTTDDTNKEVYFTADYIPSAYSQPAGSAVTAGTARSTGNAFNEPLQSGIGTITVFPVIEITSQPSGQLVSVDDIATYSIAAQKTPGGGAVGYQWQLNGNDLSDGTTTRTVIDGGTAKITLTSDAGDDTEIDFSQVSSYDSFIIGRTYTLTADADVTVKLFAEGGGGGGSGFRSVAGSVGGKSEGTFTFLKGQTYKLQVGEGGGDGSDYGDGSLIVPGGFPGGGDAPSNGSTFNRNGGGGGYTGIFVSSVTQSNSILIAGGGGGSSGDPGSGGPGGGLQGASGSNGGRAGSGGTQTAGGSSGSSGSSGESGSALKGGKGASSRFGGAGGGAGYFGGGGGTDAGPGTGGGGSGYLHPTLITDGTTTTGGSTQGFQNDGTFRIEFTAASKEVTTTVTGSNTDTLTINAEATANGTIRCKCTATDVQQSPVFSNTVSYVVVDPRSLLEIETYNYTNATATLSEFDLANGDLTIDYASYPGNAVCLYAGDKDIDIEMEMYGGIGDQGAGIDAPGGEGGYSKITFTMKKDEEYVLTGLFDLVNAPFLYRKGTLIAVVGEGGTGAKAGAHPGSDGGGIGISGSSTGRGVLGGQVVPEGQLSSNGYFGTMLLQDAAGNVNEEFRTGSEPLTHGGHTGGRTISCARGVYWRDQGKLPCEDLGTIKFRTPNGTEISNTAEIERGYKSGYNIIQTAGRGFQDKGIGGNGATGGSGGGSLYHAGAGGSGYTDGSVTVIKTQQGGSTGNAKVIIRIADPNTINPSTALQDVTFTVGRSAAFSNVITFVKESGSGPDRIAFGPNSGTVTVSMGAGAIYNLESTTINGAPGGSLRLSGGQLQLEDAGDGDYNDLTVTPNSGQFTSSTRYQL